MTEFASKLKFQCLLAKISFLGGQAKLVSWSPCKSTNWQGHFLYELFGNDNPEMECLKKFRLLNNHEGIHQWQDWFRRKWKWYGQNRIQKNMLDVCSCTDRQHGRWYGTGFCEWRTYLLSEYVKYGERLHCGIHITNTLILCMSKWCLGISKKPPRDGDHLYPDSSTSRAFIRKITAGKSLSSAPINGYGDIMQLFEQSYRYGTMAKIRSRDLQSCDAN